MELDGLRQPPLNCSRMGVVHGVADFYALDLTDPMLYGASGQAFVINMSDDL